MVAAQPAETFTARPRPAMPVVVVVSGVVLLALIGAAAAQRAFGLAAYLAIAALVPSVLVPSALVPSALARWAPGERLRGAGVALAWIGLGWCGFAIVRVPLGARVTAVLLPCCAAFALRIWALSTETALRWAHPRWARGLGAPAPVQPVEAALVAALREPPGDPRGWPAIDAAVVAVAAASPEAIPETEADRRAFWINVYNVLSAHAGRGRRSVRWVEVLEIGRTSYEVAGVRLTLEEIEHGLLRDGAPHPAAPWERMSASDPRRRWAVPLDPRLHFALNCAALSCPPVRIYRGVELDAQLEAATEAYLRAESAIDEASGALETSRLLSWYARDFGGERGVRELLARVLGVEEERTAAMRLRYRPYDWTSSV